MGQGARKSSVRDRGLKSKRVSNSSCIPNDVVTGCFQFRFPHLSKLKMILPQIKGVFL